MAKPFTRLVRRLCNQIGYDFVRLQKTYLYEEALSGLGRGGGLDAFEKTLPRPIKGFNIYFRSCGRVEIHGQNRGRFNGAPKAEVLLRCLTSLVKSINFAIDADLNVPIKLSIVDDHSSEEVMDSIRRVITHAKCLTSIYSLEEMGISFSFRRTYEIARSEDCDVIYFIEDDYLHDKHSILATVKSYELLSSIVKSDVILFPADYPALYRHINPSQILLGSDRHWRRISATTATQVVSQSLLRSNWSTYVKFSEYGKNPNVTEANTINRILNLVPGFSPLPALAVHFQQLDTISPFVDWQAWWDEADVF